jgi:hypothetical protein
MVSILFFTWAAEARHMSTDDYRRLALYIVARCAAYNVFWILAGDYQAYFYEPALYREIGKAVDAADPFDHPISIHPADDFVNREFAKESWLSYVMHQLRDAGEFLADSTAFTTNPWSTANTVITCRKACIRITAFATTPLTFEPAAGRFFQPAVISSPALAALFSIPTGIMAMIPASIIRR